MVHLNSTTPEPAARQDALMNKARDWDAERRRRAALQMGEWTLDADGTLRHKSGRKSYAEGPHSTCSCGDCQENVLPLHRQMAEALCGTPLRCKHFYIRQMLRGVPVEVRDPKTGRTLRVRAKSNDFATAPAREVARA